MDTTKKWFHYLHTTRHLSVGSISEARLKATGNKLEIPIMNEAGEHIFSKYRKEPWDESDAPKYTYETGSHIALYGRHCKSQSVRLFVTEGELDQMALRTIGYDAYSSTGGAVSWQADWELDRIPTVLYDNDEAGINGSIKTIMLLGKAIYSWIPPGFGSDIGEVLEKHGKEFCQKLLEDPVRQIKINLQDLDTKVSISRKKKELNAIAKMMEESVGKQFMLGLIKKLIELEKSLTPKKRKDMPVDSTIKDKAKAYPIQNLIKVHTNGIYRNKALCPFHSENSPSYHVYKDNTGYCHGSCGKTYDVIDIYMKQENLFGKEGFKVAIEQLSQKT